MGRPEEARRSLAWALQVSSASLPLPKLDEAATRQTAWSDLFRYPRSLLVSWLIAFPHTTKRSICGTREIIASSILSICAAPGRARRLRDSMRLGALLLASLTPASGQCDDHGHCEPLRERIDHPIHYGARYSVGPPVPGFGLRLNRSEDISMRGQHLGYFTEP